MVERSSIQCDMEVRDKNGLSIGRVDDVEQDQIKVTRAGSPDGQHHFVPIDWIERVDAHVHLNRDHAELHAAGLGNG